MAKSSPKQFGKPYDLVSRMEWVLSAIHITGPARMVLTALAWHASQKDGQCWPSVDLLMKECGLGKAAVIRAINGLEACGAVMVERHQYHHGERATNRYTLCLAADPKKLVLSRGDRPKPWVSERDLAARYRRETQLGIGERPSPPELGIGERPQQSQKSEQSIQTEVVPSKEGFSDSDPNPTLGLMEAFAMERRERREPPPITKEDPKMMAEKLTKYLTEIDAASKDGKQCVVDSLLKGMETRAKKGDEYSAMWAIALHNITAVNETGNVILDRGVPWEGVREYVEQRDATA